MKETFKKLFACLMALIMVMTVTPFTAVTASAAEAKSSNIAETEAKYKTAPSTTFTAKKGMSEVSWLNSSEVTTTEGTTYKQSFAPSSNVLYWPSAYVGTTTNLDEGANRLNLKMFYPSAVLLWDGKTDVYMPIMALAQNTQKNNPLAFDSGRTIFYAAPYDFERLNAATSPAHSTDFYADEWRGVTGSKNENFTLTRYSDGSTFGFAAEVLTSFTFKGEGAGKCYNFGLSWENDAASFLHVDSGITFDSNGYLAKKLYWTTNSYSDPEQFNTSQDNNTWQSSSTIYVVNYEPVADAANEAAEYLKTLVQTDYTPEAVNAYYDAVTALYDFDPNTYFDQNDGKSATDVEDIAVRVGKCTTEIKKLVDNYNVAKKNLKNSKQYRISFTDVNGTLVADHYYKEGETIIQPKLDSDKFINTDPEGHYTASYKWQPAISATATADVSYVEKAVIPAKTPHEYPANYTPVYQDGKYAHTRKCALSDCGYIDWAYCTFVKDEEKSKDATCTTDEILVKKCSVCGQSYTDNVNNKKKLNHDMQLVKTVAPTCADEGYDLYKCSRCDVTEKRNIVPAISGSHDWQFTKTVAPTCTEQGYDVYTCSKCSNTEKRNVKPIDSSNHNYTVTVVAPTCTEKGYTKHTCSRCGANYVSDYTPVLPALTPSEDKIAKEYGVDAKTAQEINYIFITNNVSSDTASLTESKMTAKPPKGDGDYKGSNFGLLRAQTTKLKKNSVTVKWNKVKNADGYIVYGAKCGAKSKYKVLKVVSGKTTSYTHKKLKKGTYYKYNIVAFKYVNGVKVTLAASKKIHATTLGGKYGVAKAVKLNKSKVKIKKGKTFKIKASEIKKDKKIKRHRAICYESSNTKIATVNSKGKIKAKKKGKCTIYVYAQNGVYKTVKVTVK